MSVTHPRHSRRPANTAFGRRLALTISQLAAGHVNVWHGRKRILTPGAVIGASLLIMLLVADLPRLLECTDGGPAQSVDARMNGWLAAVLGVLLLVAGSATLLAPQLRRWVRRRRTNMSNACPPRLTRIPSQLRDGVRRRGGYGLWPAHQPGRMLYGRHAQPRRTATRGYHGVQPCGHHGELHRARGPHGDLQSVRGDHAYRHRVRDHHGCVVRHGHVEPMTRDRVYGLPGGRLVGAVSAALAAVVPVFLRRSGVAPERGI